VLALLVGLAAPVHADDTARDAALARPPLFVCGTDAQQDMGYLVLSADDSGDNSEAPTGLRFQRFADGDGHEVLRFPPEGAADGKAFRFAHSDGPDGYLVSIRFGSGGADYLLYSLAVPPDPSDPNDMGGGTAALTVSRDGRQVDEISCIERPTLFIDQMRRAMACDAGAPEGPAACAETPPRRSEPIDPAALGLDD